MSMTRRQLMIAGLLAPLSSSQKNSLHIPDIAQILNPNS